MDQRSKGLPFKKEARLLPVWRARWLAARTNS
jgi:hypothetical protein